MAWYTRVQGEVVKHAGRGAKVAALALIGMHRWKDPPVPLAEMELYSTDPAKPGAVNKLPELVAKAERGGRTS